MFLQLAHTRLPIYKQTKRLVLEVYRVTKLLPSEEKFSLVLQLRRAGISVFLNVAEGCSRQSSKERIRYFEISRGSVIEVDTALEIVLELDYCREEDLETLGKAIVDSFKQLSALIKTDYQKPR